MRLMVMNDLKKVGTGACVFSGASAVSYLAHPGETQFKVVVASAVIALLLFVADGAARVLVYLGTAAVDLWLKVFTAVNEQRAVDREAAERHLDRQFARTLTLSGREPPGAGGADHGRVVARVVGSDWENDRDKEEQRDRAE
jgi:hypothetical protein